MLSEAKSAEAKSEGGKIAVDLDEVICEHLEKLLEFYNHKYNKNLSRKNFFTYDFWKVWGGTLKEAKKIVQNFYESEMFNDTLAVDGAIEGIEQLAQKNQVYIITARPERWREKTEKWIKKYLPKFKTKVIYTSDYHVNSQAKSQICKDLNIDLIIEDRSKFAKECAGAGIKVILLDKPWNQKLKENKNITRVYSWPEILDKLNI